MSQEAVQCAAACAQAVHAIARDPDGVEWLTDRNRGGVFVSEERGDSVPIRDIMQGLASLIAYDPRTAAEVRALPRNPPRPPRASNSLSCACSP